MSGRGSGTGRIPVLFVAAIVAAVDLTAKTVSEVRLADSPVELGLVQLRLDHNSGVAFSMGATLPVGVLVALTAALAVALIGYAWHRAPQATRGERLAGGAVIGGALANVIDRAGDGEVTDFLHTGWWPTFNLADTFLITGFILIAVLRLHDERMAQNPMPPV